MVEVVHVEHLEVHGVGTVVAVRADLVDELLRRAGQRPAELVGGAPDRGRAPLDLGVVDDRTPRCWPR